MKFIANWQIHGLHDKTYQAGEEVELEPADARQFVAKRYGGDVENEDGAVLVPASIIALKKQIEGEQRESEAKMRSHLKDTMKNALAKGELASREIKSQMANRRNG